MRYRLYTVSWKAWNAMLADIRRARKSVFLEMYIFLDDTRESHDFIGALARKAAKGVRVVVVADAYGSKPLRKETIEELRSAGIEIRFFSHWLRHIHRKILVVDGKVAFIGGVNIGRRFAQWNDLEVRIEGKMVGRILQSFAYTYEMAGGQDPAILAYRDRKFPSRVRDWFIEHWPLRNVYTLKDHYIGNISRSTESIRIVTPYLIPPRWLISLLDNATDRGVRVEVIIPQRSDWAIMNRLNGYYADRLSRLGVAVYLSRNMNHAKLLLIDGTAGLVGSQNIDLLSFRLNAEAGIFFRDRQVVRDLSAIADRWKDQALTFSPENRRMSPVDYIVLALMKLLRPIL